MRGDQLSNPRHLESPNLASTGVASLYIYDLKSRRTTETDPMGNTTTYTYDLFGRRVGKKLEKTVDGVLVTKEYTYHYDNEDIMGMITRTQRKRLEKYV